MRRLLVTALVVASLSACGDDTPTAAPTPTTSPAATATATTAAPSPTPTYSKECTDLAAAVKVAHLAEDGSLTEEVAEKVAESLDAKLSRLSPKVHEPAVDLHGHLHDFASAKHRGRNQRALELSNKARADATAAAKACGMPAAAFLGS
jgi:hypothetical protein